MSPETTVLLDAMHDQFADLCLIRPAVAYHYAFVYIRQIAIHLRNAMIAKRKVGEDIYRITVVIS